MTKRLLQFIFGIALLATSHPVYAQLSELQQAANEAYGSPKPTPIPTVAGNIINILLAIGGIIFLLLVVYAGYQYLTAAGDEKKVTTAKQTLANGVIGLILIIAAYSISSFVLEALSKIAKK